MENMKEEKKTEKKKGLGGKIIHFLLNGGILAIVVSIAALYLLVSIIME